MHAASKDSCDQCSWPCLSRAGGASSRYSCRYKEDQKLSKKVFDAFWQYRIDSNLTAHICDHLWPSFEGALGSIVGYHVRLDAAAHKDTKLLFCTTGILLRRMASDPTLSQISHVVLDEVSYRKAYFRGYREALGWFAWPSFSEILELPLCKEDLIFEGHLTMQVHERTLQGDFLMALLRELIGQRRNEGHPLKVR